MRSVATACARSSRGDDPMWTRTDKRFLAGLHIEADHPPPPLPRFQVETAVAPGEYQVIDTRWPRRITVTYVFAPHPLARACAELKAQELNEAHERQT